MPYSPGLISGIINLQGQLTWSLAERMCSALSEQSDYSDGTYICILKCLYTRLHSAAANNSLKGHVVKSDWSMWTDWLTDDFDWLYIWSVIRVYTMIVSLHCFVAFAIQLCCVLSISWRWRKAYKPRDTFNISRIFGGIMHDIRIIVLRWGHGACHGMKLSHH